VTLLLSLAVLAEKAGHRSFPVRWFVLVLLRHAEAVAREFVAGTTGIGLPCLETARDAGSGPADAALLAGQLRMLAALLCAILPADSRMDPRSRAFGDHRRRVKNPPAAGHGGLVSPTFDTS
jgi:hypothetical protein